MAERLNTGTLPECSISWISDDATKEIIGVQVVNDSKRTLEIVVGGRTRTFPPGTNARLDFPNPQKVAWLERTMQRADGKVVSSWLPGHTIRFAD